MRIRGLSLLKKNLNTTPQGCFAKGTKDSKEIRKGMVVVNKQAEEGYEGMDCG